MYSSFTSFHNMIRSLFGHYINRNIGVGCGRSGIEKSKKVVDFSDGTYGGSRISVGGFLIDRDDWGESINKIDFSTLHHSNELTCVGRQRFDKTSLAFRIDGINGERSYLGSAQDGQDAKLP